MNQSFCACEAVKNRIAQYMDAVYRADVAELKTIFHEKASMNGYLGEMLLVGTPEPFFADLSSKPSMADNKDDCRYVVQSLSVTGGIANVTILVDGFYGAATIQDCFHLVCEQGQWKIVCKTFTTL